VAEGLSAWNAERQEILNPRADEPPALIRRLHFWTFFSDT
jgi:hypothetical protein